VDGHRFVPDVAIGRLVETPEEISTTITTFISQGGILDLGLLSDQTTHKVLVTGYDFLSDAGRAIRLRWKGALGASTPDGSPAPVDGR